MNKSNYLDISKVFSPVFMDNLANGNLQKVHKILNSAKNEFDNSFYTNLQELLNLSYCGLEENYRNEYYFKNTLFNSVILNNHNLDNCVALTEFPAGKSFIDIAVFNGTSTAYEIKSEKDTPKRLFSQLSDYIKSFEFVYLVSYDTFIKKIIDDLPQNIGIYSLKENKKEFDILRIAKSNLATFDHTSFFDSLRINEIKNIINLKYGYVPNLPNTLIYKECFKLFSNINLSELHLMYIAEIRKREMSAIQKELIHKIPESIKVSTISKRYSRKQCENIIQTLEIIL